MFDCDFNNCIFYSDGRCTSLEDTHSRKTYLHCKYHEYKYTAELVNTPVTDLYSVAITLCNCFSDCKNCPVFIFDYDKRTEYEKCCLHEPCQVSLYKWLRDKAFEEVFEDTLDKFINTPEVYPISAEDLKEALERSNNKYSLKRSNNELN